MKKMKKIKILNIRDFANSKQVARSSYASFDTAMKRAVAKAAKQGICFGSDQRAYVPERLRGKGVGYGKHGK